MFLFLYLFNQLEYLQLFDYNNVDDDNYYYGDSIF